MAQRSNNPFMDSFLSVLGAAAGLLALGVVITLLQGDAMEEVTDHAEADWEPVVNPMRARANGSGWVPALFRVKLEDGTTCYATLGAFHDELECWKPLGTEYLEAM